MISLELKFEGFKLAGYVFKLGCGHLYVQLSKLADFLGVVIDDVSFSGSHSTSYG